MRVKIDNRLLRGFIKRAKARYPNEHVEMLYGRKVGDTFHIVALTEPEQTGKSKSVVWWEYEDDDVLEEVPSKPPLLGTIHSHPRESEASPSEFDWRRQCRDGEQIAGICALWRKSDNNDPLRSRVRFYVADALMGLETL